MGEEVEAMGDAPGPESPYTVQDEMGRPLLKGAVCVVTGGSRGIGRAIVETFAANGAAVCIAYQREGSWVDDLRQMLAGPPRDAMFVQADVARAADVDTLFDSVKRRWGRVDVLVNNAGVSGRYPLELLDEAEWDRVNDTNLKGAFLCTRAFLRLSPAPVGDRSPSILFMSSVRASRGFADNSHYIATKGGLEALTRALAIELAGRGIRVNCIAPGAIATDMNRDVLADEAYRDKVLARIPLGRIGRPMDVAGAALFLSSPLARFISGAVLPVDGGEISRG